MRALPFDARNAGRPIDGAPTDVERHARRIRPRQRATLDARPRNPRQGFDVDESPGPTQRLAPTHSRGIHSRTGADRLALLLPRHGLSSRFDDRHPEVARHIDALAEAGRERHGHVNEPSMPTSNENLGVAGERRVHGISCHVPAIDAVVGRRRDAANVIARVDVFECCIDAPVAEMLHDPVLQDDADVAQSDIAARVCPPPCFLVAELLPGSLGDDDDRVRIAS